MSTRSDHPVIVCIALYGLQVWYAWAVAHDRDGGENVAHQQAVLDKARQALPDCVMLHFALADSYESQSRLPEALGIYEVICPCAFAFPTLPLPASPFCLNHCLNKCLCYRHVTWSLHIVICPLPSVH
jgi:hypothetical protein